MFYSTWFYVSYKYWTKNGEWWGNNGDQVNPCPGPAHVVFFGWWKFSFWFSRTQARLKSYGCPDGILSFTVMPYCFHSFCLLINVVIIWYPFYVLFTDKDECMTDKKNIKKRQTEKAHADSLFRFKTRFLYVSILHFKREFYTACMTYV